MMTDYADPNGWPAFWRMFRAGSWEPWTKALIDELRPRDIYVDIGAWIGPLTQWALGRGAHVIAIEPDPVAVAELRRLTPRAVEIWPGALTLDGGIVHLSPWQREGGEYGDSGSFIATSGIEVPSWSLESILDGRRPKLVTIDVEGYEMTLCPWLMPWLAELGATVQVSFHGSMPDPAWFSGFRDVTYPDHPFGDVVAR